MLGAKKSHRKSRSYLLGILVHLTLHADQTKGAIPAVRYYRGRNMVNHTKPEIIKNTGVETPTICQACKLKATP
jgi:hypothetical protein